MNRNFFYILAIGLLLILACIGLEASAIATDEQITTYARYDPNVTIAKSCPEGMNVTEVNPNDQVLIGTCADLRIVEGWYGKVVHHSGAPVIDVSSYTRTILINPEIWKVGEYYQWAQYEEPKANLYMFTVVTTLIPKEEFVNVTVGNVTPVELPSPFRYNLAEKPISDVLVARGDPLSFNNSRITNLTRAWLFGVNDRLYDVPCENGLLFVNESMVLSLRPGMYYLLLDNPGTNTLPEAIWNEEKERVTSPLRATPYLEVPGYDPRTVYDKIVPWLKTYSDDVVEVYKVEVQEPYLEITGIGTMYSGITDVLQVDGYTNLAIGTKVYAVIDEDTRSMDIISVPRTYGEVRGLIEKPGTMREFRIDPPFDYQNKTSGTHMVTVHGPFKTFMTVGVPVGLMPEGQERPKEYIRYINSTLWNPTPTPIIKEKIVTQIVTQYVTVPVTPSNEQVHAEQTKVQWEIAWTVAQWLVAALIGIAIVGYVYLIWRRL
jgi:hypothetical protein